MTRNKLDTVAGIENLCPKCNRSIVKLFVLIFNFFLFVFLQLSVVLFSVPVDPVSSDRIDERPHVRRGASESRATDKKNKKSGPTESHETFEKRSVSKSHATFIKKKKRPSIALVLPIYTTIVVPYIVYPIYTIYSALPIH